MPDGFLVVSNAAAGALLGTGSSATFVLRPDDTFIGIKSGVMQLANNDGQDIENPFDFNLRAHVGPKMVVNNGVNTLVNEENLLDFGMVEIGDSVSRCITISRPQPAAGTDLSVNAQVLPTGFVVDDLTLTIALDESDEVCITYAPTAPCETWSQLSIASNDPSQPDFTINVLAIGKCRLTDNDHEFQQLHASHVASLAALNPESH